MILVWLAEKIINELKGEYADGDITRVIKFVEKTKADNDKKPVFISFDEYLNAPRDESLHMCEQVIVEIEKALVHGDQLYVKYAYLNLIELASLLSETREAV